MALPLSVGECLELVQQGLKIYNKIKHDVPDLVAEVVERIESLELFLKRLRKTLTEDDVLTKIAPSETSDLEKVLSKMRVDISKVIAIIEKWNSNVGPWGLQFKFKAIPQALFALGSSPKELEELGKKLDRRQDEIRDWNLLLQNRALAQLLKGGQAPSPHPQSVEHGRTDCNIIFVDPYNEGRSVVAESYALLCREWTVRTGGRWPINLIHSAGLYIKARSGTARLQQQLGMDMSTGNEPPLDIALGALFDKQPFTYQYKYDIQKRVAQRKSRGLTEDLFSTYDYVIIFNHHNQANLDQLRDALRKKNAAAVSPGKGKLVLLGQYGTSGHEQIFNAKKGPDGKDSLENWTTTVSNIETSFRGFLKKEMGWIQPAPGTKQVV